MKIILPYYTRSGILIDDKKTIGGLEKFAQLVYQNIPDVIPVHYTDEDRKARLVTSKVVRAAREHNADIVITNYENETLSLALQVQLDIPIMWISHSCTGGIGRLKQITSMATFIDNGGIVYMMSENQYIGLDKLSKRINNGKELFLSGGYLNSAFASGLEKVSDQVEYDAVTIGRINKEKNPFWIHKKLADTGKHSVVLTNYIKEFMSEGQEEYYSENKHWNYPQETILGLSHVDTLTKMSKAAAYISTHPRESWGITALEALSHGLPTMLVTDCTGIHSSECIAADRSHILNIPMGIKKCDLADLLTKFRSMSIDERLSISELTKEKHSRKKWVSALTAAIDKTITVYIKPKSGLIDFFE